MDWVPKGQEVPLGIGAQMRQGGRFRPSHAHFRLADTMAGTPAATEAFLADIADRLRPRLEADLEDLRELKRVECDASGQPPGASLGRRVPSLRRSGGRASVWGILGLEPPQRVPPCLHPFGP